MMIYMFFCCHIRLKSIVVLVVYSRLYSSIPVCYTKMDWFLVLNILKYRLNFEMRRERPPGDWRGPTGVLATGF